jgi:hypothetical protein
VSSSNQLTNKTYVDTQLATKQPTGNYVTTNTDQSITSLKSFGANGNYGIKFVDQDNIQFARLSYGYQDPGNQAGARGAVISGTLWAHQSSLRTLFNPVNNEDLARKKYVDDGLATKATDASCVHITGNETIAGVKTLTNQLVLTGGFNASTTQSINFGSNSLTAAALRLGTTPYSLLGSIICGQLDTNRKIVLYPLENNGIQNYSLGVSNTAGEFILLIPSDTRKFRFDYGTSATTKTNIMTIEPYKTNLNIGSNDATNQFTIKTSLSIPYKTLFSVSDFNMEVIITNGCNLKLNDETKNNVLIKSADGTVGGGITLFNNTSFYMYQGTTTASSPFFSLDYIANGMSYYGTACNYYNTNFNVLNSSGVQYGQWNTSALDLSGCLLKVEQMNVAHSTTGSITGTTTISKPFNQYYAVEVVSTAYTITLPTITDREMGKEIIFRKVKQGTVSVSFIGNGTQKVYNTALTGGTGTQALMTTGVYTVRLVALLDATTGGGAFAWFQV